MPFDNKLEAELLQVMEDYWDSYFKGDLQRWAAYLPDEYKNIDTAKAKIWNNKKEIVDFTENVVEQTVGITEVRDKETQIIPYDPYVMVHELGDLYVKVEDDWVFYAQFRLSSLLENTAEGWKILHQHGSYPGSIMEEAETFESEELKAENKKLRDAIQARTLELERKNRELEIEAALEKVRARSLAMHHTSELQDVINTVHQQFLSLHIEITGGVFISINKDIKEKNEIICWGAGSTADYVQEVSLPFVDRPIYTGLLAGLKKPGFFTEAFSYEAKMEFFKYLFKHPPYSAASPKRKKEVLSKSGGYTRSGMVSKHTSIFMINHHGRKFTAAENDILKRFGIVFEQAYTRFLDLQKAEKQAREAQIEAALERVRSRSMAMHKSSELSEVSTLLFKELNVFCSEILASGIVLCDREPPEQWMCSPDMHMLPPIHIPKDLDAVIYNLYQSWESRTELYSEFIEGQALQQHNNALMTVPEIKAMFEHRPKDMYVPQSQTNYAATFKQGYLLIITEKPFAGKALFPRFAKVFEQTYTRFLDLQKAEAQAREAQIEAALERVRSATMAMHQSADLHQAASVLFEQLSFLGAELFSCGFVLCEEDNRLDEQWMYAQEAGKFVTQYIPHEEERVHFNLYKAWKAGTPLYSEAVEGLELEGIIKFLMAQPSVQKNLSQLISEGVEIPKFQKLHGATFSKGYLLIITTSHFAEERIFIRFAKVFEQTYTRFLDLQKAEAQAREAQMEATLERIRAASMAMQHSDELPKVALQFLTQLELQAVPIIGSSLDIVNEEKQTTVCYLADNTKNNVPQLLCSKEFEFSKHEFTKKFKQKLNQGIKEFTIEAKDEFIKKWIEWIEEMFSAERAARLKKAAFKKVFFSCIQIYNGSSFTVSSLLPLSEEHWTTIRRMANTFVLSYQRFLDLKKAELQAREAQIEAALEQVRSRTMAMRESQELREVVSVMYDKMELLGLAKWGVSIIICHEDTEEFENWLAEGTDSHHSGNYFASATEHPVYRKIWEHWKSQGPPLTLHHQDDYKREFDEYWLTKTDFKYLPDVVKKSVFDRNEVFLNYATMRHGLINAVSFEKLSDDLMEVLARFAKVFEQTYTRFLDLQKAEAQAKDALKQAALDRVRGEIASMRNTEDLNRITPVIWRELIALEVPFIRCGVFIVNEETEMVEVYLTTPEGAALGVLNLPFDINSQTTNTVKYWQEKKVYRENWDAQAFTDWTQSMIDLGQVNDLADYKGATEIPNELHLNFIPFKQGMLYVGDVNPLQDDKIEMVKTLAEAFSIAYARYEDFVQLEQAKSAVEVTLEELKSTQAQLIQSEKMASLGELTAGIAHEIQNPLNFVNNFSEVSHEILDEMMEEIEKGDLEEVKIIASDIKQNLKKINHHGKRADAIVKGMLQHSRKNSGEKTLTDINQLADEYLRLAYHGLRAKDKSFNATLNTDYDPSLDKINIIPQDLGRVILNLITNAFYAVNEKKKLSNEGFEPTVTVRTQQKTDQIIISVKDNGKGIPQKVLDKIFQPFFTTKPTGQGTGLGLSLSYDIIKAHGGKLEVETEEGAYTLFKIILPPE